MALKKFWGAETATLSELLSVQTGLSVDTAVSSNSGGARSFKCDGSATANTRLADDLGGLSAIYVALRFRADFSSAPSANRACRLCTTTTVNGATSLGFCNMQHLTNGNWRIYFGDGASGNVQGTAYEWAYESGTWLDISFYMHKDGGWIKVNGTTVYTLNQNNVLWSTGTMDRITGLSCSSSDTARPFWLDDYCVGDADFGGQPSVIARQPAAEGTYTSWTASAGTKVSCVNATPASTSTYIYYSSGVPIGAQTFTVNSFSSTETGKGSGTIGSNDTLLGAWVAAATYNSVASFGIDVRQRVNGTDTDFSFSLTNAASWYYNNTVLVDFADRFPFYPTLSQLNGAEVGVDYTIGGGYQSRCCALWIGAAYVPPQGTEYTRTVSLAGAGAGAAEASKYTSIFIMPDADVSANGWTAVGAASLFAAIDDASVDDADYILSPNNPAGEACELSLAGQAVMAPLSIRYRAARLGDATTVTIKIMEGAVERVTRSRALTADLTDYEDFLTSEEIASVSNWSNVTVKISAV